MKNVSYTYWIFDRKNMAVKVGTSHDPLQRLKQLQTSNSIELKLVGMTNKLKEKDVHKLYAKHHLKGEWYKMNSEIQRHIIKHSDIETPFKIPTDDDMLREKGIIPMGEIKGFARTLPDNHVLKDIILSEPDTLDAHDFMAKWEIWIKLLKIGN